MGTKQTRKRKPRKKLQEIKPIYLLASKFGQKIILKEAFDIKNKEIERSKKLEIRENNIRNEIDLLEIKAEAMEMERNNIIENAELGYILAARKEFGRENISIVDLETGEIKLKGRRK